MFLSREKIKCVSKWFDQLTACSDNRLENSIISSSVINPADDRILLRCWQTAILRHTAIRNCCTDSWPGIKNLRVRSQCPGSVITAWSVATGIGGTGRLNDRVDICWKWFGSPAAIHHADCTCIIAFTAGYDQNDNYWKGNDYFFHTLILKSKSVRPPATSSQKQSHESGQTHTKQALKRRACINQQYWTSSLLGFADCNFNLIYENATTATSLKFTSNFFYKESILHDRAIQCILFAKPVYHANRIKAIMISFVRVDCLAKTI